VDSQFLPFPLMPSRRLFTLAEARAMSAARLKAMRIASGMSPREWAAFWSARFGADISAGMVMDWEDPLSDYKPPSHWSLAMLAWTGPDVVEPISRSLFASADA